MTEQEFIDRCDHTLEAIEDALEDCGVEVDAARQGPVLELEFDDGSKIIVNGNAPVREMWVAARTGAHHFRDEAGRWVDTRSGEELFATLSRLVSQLGGEAVVLAAR
jgi:CyaY protein